MVYLADIKEFDIGMFFYDKFRARISSCKRTELKNLRNEIHLHYQESCNKLSIKDVKELTKIYLYLIQALDERWKYE